MAITTGDGYIAAAKQQVIYTKTASATTVAAQPFSMFALAGNPGAGTLAIGNTTNGVVPTDATAGYPVINAFGGSATGYLTRVEFANTVASRFALFDRLYAAGAVSMTSLATTTFTSQPSFSARNGGSFVGLEIWLEITTTVSSTATTISVTYVNQDGTTGRSTGATGTLSGFTSPRLIPMPLQSGDSGVQQITSVTVGGTVATAGAFNVMVLRPLWSGGRVKIANDGDVHGIDRVGMPIVYADSALYPVIWADSTSSGIPDLTFEIANR